METVQLVLAAKWAVDVINNQSLPHELSIGKLKTKVIFRNNPCVQVSRYMIPAVTVGRLRNNCLRSSELYRAMLPVNPGL